MTAPTKDQIEHMKQRSRFWENRLQENCLTPWSVAMQELGAVTSAMGNKTDIAIEFTAMQTAPASLMSNMLLGFTMTGAQGKPKATENLINVTLLEMQQFIERAWADIRSGGSTDLHIIEMHKGKPVPFDFRDHITRDSGRPSSVGG